MHLSPPFRAEHVGSLLRPKALYEKRRALEAGECSACDLKSVEDQAVKHVLKLQQDVGIKTITDGEMRRFVGLSTPHVPGVEYSLRGYFFEGVFEKLEGMTYIPNRMFVSPLIHITPNSQHVRAHFHLQGKPRRRLLHLPP